MAIRVAHQHYDYPENYRPMAFCRTCGKDFSGDYLFDEHRTGTHEYDYEEGLKFDPPVEDGRRCKTSEELIQDGMRPMTEREMLATKRHKHRIGYGVEMWFDPSEVARVSKRFNKVSD